MFYITICLWLDSNRRPLSSEATTLSTEPQPLPANACLQVRKHLQCPHMFTKTDKCMGVIVYTWSSWHLGSTFTDVRMCALEQANVVFIEGCCHSSVDSSAPSILLPWVWLPSMPSTLFSFMVKFFLYLSVQCEKRMKTNKKEAGFGPFKKTV